MAHGWEGELVRLVRMEREKHFENALRWINDPEVTATLSFGDMPTSTSSQEAWFERVTNSSDDVVFAIETMDGRHIGQSGVHQINYRDRRALTGSFIGASEDRGKGYGTDAARVRSRYAFEVLGLEMLTSAFFEGNEGSRRMQEKSGYVEYGRLPRAHWKRGQWRTMIHTYLTIERWKALNSSSPQEL